MTETRGRFTRDGSRAFTLIELLMVVAIIALLAAIALPNFLAAQTRSKISRVHADHHALTVALEAFRVDNGNLPQSLEGASKWEMGPLTYPVQYIKVLPLDVFPTPPSITRKDYEGYYDFVRYELEKDQGQTKATLHVAGKYTETGSKYFVLSNGPDRFEQRDYYTADLPAFDFDDVTYDPSNGTVSYGDILSQGASSSSTKK